MGKIFDVGSAAELLAVPPGARGFSHWVTVDQSMIDRFADATGDHQWIHVDRARAAREMPEGKTIAHGYLTLSLLPQLLDGTWTIRNELRSLNYGAERLRFVSPVQCGSRLRMNAALFSANLRDDGGVRLVLDCAIEIENALRPAVALQQIALFYFDES